MQAARHQAVDLDRLVVARECPDELDGLLDRARQVDLSRRILGQERTESSGEVVLNGQGVVFD